jgi:transcriptional regulator with XRE-family HTH domain
MKVLSQQNMAVELDLSQRHYGRIENGQVDINYSLLCKIADALGVKLQHLIGMDEMLIFNNINQHLQNGQFIAYNATEVENITKLYERLATEKDEHIVSLKNLPIRKK